MRWPTRLAIVVAAGSCVTTRTVIQRPGLAIEVVDATGQPLPGVEVVVTHITYPYARVESAEPFVADANGRVTTAELTGDERIMPLCMHGVPGHAYTVCASLPDKGSAVVHWRPDEPKTVELRLDPARTAPCERPKPVAAPPTK